MNTIPNKAQYKRDFSDKLKALCCRLSEYLSTDNGQRKIKYIPDIIAWKWVFENLWEEWFDDYRCNYGILMITDSIKWNKKLTNLDELLKYKNVDTSLLSNQKQRWRKQ